MDAESARLVAEKCRQLHDSQLIEVKFVKKREVSIVFLTTSGESKQLRFMDVANFFCNGMLEGNTVDSVEVVVAGELRQDDLSYFVREEGRGESSERMHKSMLARDLTMICILPSYGAEIGCVCMEAIFVDL